MVKTNWIFLLAGNFGVGKSSLCRLYPHVEIAKGLTETHGLLALGGKHGADSLLGQGFNKKDAFDKLVWPNHNRNILVHSVFYQATLDLGRYLKHHDLFVFFLKTSFSQNEKRIAERGKAINVLTFVSARDRLKTLQKECSDLNVPFLVVDNDREFCVVAEEVYGKIASLVGPPLS